MPTDNRKLEHFGFSFERGGAHIARTMMFGELEALLSYINTPTPSKADYFQAIIEHNCLGKRSEKGQRLAYRHLVDLYALDVSVAVFRVLLYFWQRDPQSRRLLALLCAYSRDPVLRLTAPLILNLPQGTTITRETAEAFIDGQQPGRFSRATLRSTAQNINGTWTQSGHLTGHVRKVRTRPSATPAAAAYALFLGFLTGARGQSLFSTEYIALIDCSYQQALELAESAALRGWIVFKRVKDVMEILFPNLLSEQEMEWLREQG